MDTLAAVKRLTFSVALAGASFLINAQVGAQQLDSNAWPERVVTIIVPIAVGGGTDLITRALADELQAAWKRPVIVKNQAGGNGIVGTSTAAHSPADGYTLLVGTQGTFAANTCLYKLPYDAAKDFSPVTLFAQFNSVFVVRADSPIQSLPDLVRRAKADPGKLTYGITVVGSSAHLGVEMFRDNAGIDILGVPYNGAVPATLDLLGGRLDFMLDAVNSQYGNITSGKMRALASTSATRSSALPQVPTVAEQGYPDFNAVGWAGLYTPAGVPQPIIDKIARTVADIYASGKLQSKLGNQGFEFVTATPEAFAAHDKSERDKWCSVIKKAGIKVN